MLSKVTLLDTFSLIKQRTIFLCSSVCYSHLFILELTAGNIFFLYSFQ
jgi:hypothetical protein